MNETIRQAAYEAGLDAWSEGFDKHLKAFAASIARQQRDADLRFMKTRGRALPATCQQKAIQAVRENLKIEKLITD